MVEPDGRLLDLGPLSPDIDGDFLSHLLPGLDTSGLPELPDPGRRGPPIARPGKVVGIGLNYTSYAAAVGVAPPAEPVVFLKASTSVCGPTDTVHGLPGSRTTDYEVELGVVIGRRLSGRVDAQGARAAIAGYVLANDVTDRALAGVGGPWAKGKCADTFCPIGPWLVTPDELGEPGEVELCLSVNRTVRQRACTSEMVFDVPALLVYLGGLMTLEPGDLVLTGTPAGVAVARPEPRPFLRDGDVMELTATGLGAQRNPVRGACGTMSGVQHDLVIRARRAVVGGSERAVSVAVPRRPDRRPRAVRRASCRRTHASSSRTTRSCCRAWSTPMCTSTSPVAPSGRASRRRPGRPRPEASPRSSTCPSTASRRR